MGLRLTKLQQSGFVFIVVLCTIILLEVLLLGFNFRCRASLRAVDHLRRSQQALNCARAGLNIAIAAIKDTPDIHTNKTLLDPLSGQNSVTVGDGQCLITVTEESGKLNVNLLKDKNGKLNRIRIDQLLRLIDLLNREQPGDSDIGYGLAPAIIDWTDDDEQVTCLEFVKHQNLGAESDYYSKLEPPYKCKNKPLEVIDEMLLIKDVTAESFDRLRAYLTVNGDGKININFAPKLVIESLSQKMDTALARMIVDRRKIKPFESIMELRDVPGMTDSIYQSIKNTVTVSPEDQYYRIESQGNVGHVGCTIDAILRRNPETKSVEVVFYKELR
ncbi:MAG: general secretion pathway protein GspK [Phycisphaerae bacterium]